MFADSEGGMMDKVRTVFWRSDTHQGSIQRGQGTTAGGVTHDLGIWAGATEIKTGRREHDLPYDSVKAAMKRLAEKYPGFQVVAAAAE
jgi:hypothetical protein